MRAELLARTPTPPATPERPRWVAPLPRWLEDWGLRLAWPIAIVNLVGTAFGVWYYAGRPTDLAAPLLEGHLGAAPLWQLPLIPDSPVATLLIALSLIVWRLDPDREWAHHPDWLHVLAVVGCLKLGLWTPYVQLVINGPGHVAPWLYWFLIGSHLLMAVEAFVVHRYARFTPRAIAIALGWYALQDIADYTAVLGPPTHTRLAAEWTGAGYDHTLAAHDLAALGALVLTILAALVVVGVWRVQRRESGPEASVS
ncbi:DUF1405 domain-containing protein [Halococcoides cellulosivorans]|uniref:DUF1405 domain-containing protein n=1 Tax=Halococcoides cellulosivorans TaxID=1679096 RepID=UPI001F387D41|nr:DUF1405 domain-containing protein [Halococcoides cellulosivorans]